MGRTCLEDEGALCQLAHSQAVISSQWVCRAGKGDAKVSLILLSRDAWLCCEHTLLRKGESQTALAYILANLRSQTFRYSLFFLKKCSCPLISVERQGA